MQLSDVEIPTADGQLRGVLAVPDEAGPFPAVIMVHEVFGIDESMRVQIQRMCSAGYIVLMPDLFSRGGMRKCLNATFRALVAGEGQAFDDVSAATAMVSSRADCTGKVGVVGFCMGGAFALQLAARGYDASAVNYGQLPKNLDDVLAGACPIIASYGAQDPSLKGAASKLEAALTKAGVVHQVTEYPGASHSFMNPVQAGPTLLRPFMNKVVGFKPNPEAAQDAWARIEKFFGEHLGDG